MTWIYLLWSAYKLVTKGLRYATALLIGIQINFVIFINITYNVFIKQKDSILAQLLSNGSGNVYYATKLLEFGGLMPELSAIRSLIGVYCMWSLPVHAKRRGEHSGEASQTI